MSKTESEIPFLIGEDFVRRRNVAWRVEIGRTPDNPLLEPEMPWDDGHPFLHGTVLLDPTDGIWKAWGAAGQNDTKYRRQARRLAYLESEDGIDWRRPELDLYPFGDHARTNIVMDLDSGGNAIYANVFVQPEAPEAQRYRMFVLRRFGLPSRDLGVKTIRGFTGPDGKESRSVGVYCYNSPDGLHWEPDVGPVLVESADLLSASATTDGIFIYPEPDGSFSAYHKVVIRGFPGSILPYESGPGATRVLVRRTSEDGIHWGMHEPCIQPDWRDPNDTEFMEMAVTPVAGGYVGVLTLYRTSNQTLELQFAASRDGRYWWRPDRRACVEQPPLGDYGGGMMWGSHHMIGDGDDIHFYYSGLQGIHGDMLGTQDADQAALEGRDYAGLPPLHGEVYSRSADILYFHGALCRATWRRGRLWGLATASGGHMEGTAVTSAEMDKGQSLDINASTVKDGEILAELLDGEGRVAQGFDRDACDPFSGDAPLHRITWKGKAAAPADGLQARFILRRAVLYGFEFSNEK